MSNWMHPPKTENHEYQFEAGTLRSGLLIACVYEGIQVIRDIITHAPYQNTIINSLVLVLLLSLLLATQKRNNTFLLAAIAHLILLPVFIFFWTHYNGANGSVPYFIFLYFPFIIFTLQGALRFLLIGLYSLMILYLMVFPELFNVQTFDVNNQQEILSLSIDCFFAAILLSVFFIRVKRRFEKYRSLVLVQNQELQTLHTHFDSQNTLIEAQKGQIEQFNSHLHELVLERAAQVETRHKMLSKYAFVNAHVLRGPLSRVMGLLNLIALEQQVNGGDPEKIHSINYAAEEMDKIIRKINNVLH